ncbi:MAG: glycosyltransferase [Clostridia bacterium]|nr:MAG: glycosyltransferase [Clostridia bacterium]
MAGVSVLIPAYQAAAHIYPTVTTARELPGVERVVVVDDGSTDDTASLAEAAGAVVLRLPANMGKGEALNRGVPLLSGRLVLLLDADLEASAGQAWRLLEPLVRGEAEVSIGVPLPREECCQIPGGGLPEGVKGGGLGLARGLAALGIYAFTGRRLQAPLSGQRAMTRRGLERLLPLARGFGVEVAMTVRAHRLGMRVVEVEMPFTHAVTGRDLRGFYHRGRQFLDISRALWLCLRESREEPAEPRGGRIWRPRQPRQGN